MAGNPKKNAMRAELERRTRTEFPDEPEATTLDYVCRWLADGKTFRSLCRDLGVSAPMVYDSLNHAFGSDTVRAEFAKAREVGAHQLVDEAIEIADDAPPEEAALANLRVRARQWTAERWNRRELGVDKGGSVSVSLSLGQLMINALVAPPPPAPGLEESKQDILAPTRDTPTAQLGEGSPAGESAIASAIAEEAEVLSIEEPTSSGSEQ